MASGPTSPPSPAALDPPFRGHIETTYDALLVFEAARRGMIPRVTRRLIERERGMIQSGAVFVFDEHESGIKRWTDGMIWSPSRILGNFLVSRRDVGAELGPDHLGISRDRQTPNHQPYLGRCHHGHGSEPDIAQFLQSAVGHDVANSSDAPDARSRSSIRTGRIATKECKRDWESEQAQGKAARRQLD